MKTIINLTPHAIHVHIGTPDTGIAIATIPSDGEARCEEIIIDESILAWDQFGDSGMRQNIPLRIKGYGKVIGLPEPRDGVLYCVSTLVAQQVVRDDLVTVDQVVRDDQGRIIGCRGFARL